MDQFRQNMRWLRNRNNLSQEAFGNLFGLTRGQMDSYERGKAWPSIEDANKICKYFDITLDMFFNQELTDSLMNGPESTKTSKYEDKDWIIEQLEIDKQDLRKAKANADELIDRLKAEIKELKASIKGKVPKK